MRASLAPQWSRLQPHMIMRAQVDRLARLNSAIVPRLFPCGLEGARGRRDGDSRFYDLCRRWCWAKSQTGGLQGIPGGFCGIAPPGIRTVLGPDGPQAAQPHLRSRQHLQGRNDVRGTSPDIDGLRNGREPGRRCDVSKAWGDDHDKLRLIAECLRCAGPQKVGKQLPRSTHAVATREEEIP